MLLDGCGSGGEEGELGKGGEEEAGGWAWWRGGVVFGVGAGGG